MDGHIGLFINPIEYHAVSGDPGQNDGSSRILFCVNGSVPVVIPAQQNTGAIHKCRIRRRKQGGIKGNRHRRRHPFLLRSIQERNSAVPVLCHIGLGEGQLPIGLAGSRVEIILDVIGDLPLLAAPIGLYRLALILTDGTPPVTIVGILIVGQLGQLGQILSGQIIMSCPTGQYICMQRSLRRNRLLPCAAKPQIRLPAFFKPIVVYKADIKLLSLRIPVEHRILGNVNVIQLLVIVFQACNGCVLLRVQCILHLIDLIQGQIIQPELSYAFAKLGLHHSHFLGRTVRELQTVGCLRCLCKVRNGCHIQTGIRPVQLSGNTDVSFHRMFRRHGQHGHGAVQVNRGGSRLQFRVLPIDGQLHIAVLECFV